MSKQYHYIVKFDNESREFSLDHEALNERYQGVVFDTATQRWHDDLPLKEYLAVQRELADLLTASNGKTTGNLEGK